MPERILPGSRIGMLGGGQLGRMSLLAGRKLGYEFFVIDPADPCPAGAVSDVHYPLAYDNPFLVDELKAETSVVTLEFENVPKELLEGLEGALPVRPARGILEICQDRLKEKRFFEANGIGCAPFEPVDSLEELDQAVARLGCPSVLKTARFGYDGKGQVKIEAGTDLAEAWAAVGRVPSILEGWVPFEGEYSVIAARNAEGETAVFPVFRNRHRDHILWMSVAPGGLSDEHSAAAIRIGEKVVEALGLEGLLAVELFLTKEGWLVNEMAPRPHNSGHLTLDVARTSQFEQHIRAVANLPLGDPALMQPAVMVNLLGDLWVKGEPDWSALLQDPRVKLHLYGKTEARAGRKMGHFTVLGEDVGEVERAAMEHFERLRLAAEGK